MYISLNIYLHIVLYVDGDYTDTFRVFSPSICRHETVLFHETDIGGGTTTVPANHTNAISI